MAYDIQEVGRLHEVSKFLFLEARLQDEHRYAEWENIWTDDAVYWVPANGETYDPEMKMSIIYDNRSRIGLRIKQFFTGKRFAQIPVSRIRRIVGNIEILGEEPLGLRVSANVLLFESSRRGDVVWASRNEYVLREVEGQWRLAHKRVSLVNNDAALLTMAFLI